MASPTPVSQFKSVFSEPNFATTLQNPISGKPKLGSFFLPRRLSVQFQAPRWDSKMSMKAVTVSATTAENAKKRYPAESKGFVEEMRFLAMKLHTKEQAKEGEKEISQPEEQSVVMWEPTTDGHLRFLVDSKLVFDTLEKIVADAAYPYYAEFRNTGLERSASLAKDLEWFREQGHVLPEPSSPGLTYAQYLKELSVKDPQAFICHFYNIYFAHSAGGRMVGKKVAEKILDKKVLEFYKWDGQLSQMLQNVRDKLDKVAEGVDSRRKESLFGRNREIVQAFRRSSASDISVIIITVCTAYFFL